ncbi:MAG TPA: bifunctional DNA primase/polymerase [Companilactobacillus farciminis]|uniref:Bifunctional DNA primase/polymerase n=1 Tax=Companilactobacillus farciminis TaxID=1612 RepID=A0A921HT08_9LACO|nr:bifunctional DNA primase/polymerase [Companilactobacillus farciminis]
MTTYEMAMELAKRHIYYYPTAPGSKSGIKDTHGFSDAVCDSSKAQEWFQGTNNNIGINLKKSGLMVVDVDMHGNGNGRHNLLKVFQTYGRLPDDTLIERTPHNGIHYFLKVPSGVKVKSQTSAFFDQSGIDLMCNNILIAPSTIDGASYAHVSGSYDDIKQAPTWLLEFAQDKPANNVNSGTPRLKKYTGALLDKIVKGATKGQRNDFITSVAGSMLAVGTSASNVYELLSVINNSFVSPSLPQKELETIYRSVLMREIEKLKAD